MSGAITMSKTGNYISIVLTIDCDLKAQDFEISHISKEHSPKSE